MHGSYIARGRRGTLINMKNGHGLCISFKQFVRLLLARKSSGGITFDMVLCLVVDRSRAGLVPNSPLYSGTTAEAC